MKTRYERLAEQRKNLYSELTYFDFLLGVLCSMFTWDGLPVEQRHLEEYLHINGSLGVQPSDKVPEGFLFVPDPGRDQTLDQFAEGTHAHGVTLGGGLTLDGEIGKDVAICYNNSLHTPDFDLLQYANYLMSVDKAMMINTKISGFAPILFASDSTAHKRIDDMLSQLLEGEIKVIKDSAEDTDKLIQTAPEQGVYSIDLSSKDRISSVQYHSQLWDDLMRRFFSKYGIDIQHTNKRAQVTTDEANALDAFSWILPLDMLQQRQQFCTVCNTIFRTSWSVRFSDLWQMEYNKYSYTAEHPEEQEGGEDDDTGNDSASDGADAGDA